MRVLHLDGYYGLGDNIYQRPFVIEALRQYDKVYLTTPWPELYHNILRLYFVRPQTHLRAQAANIALYPDSFWSKPQDVTHSLRFDYHSRGFRREKNILQSFEEIIPLPYLNFTLPIAPEWITKAKQALKTIKPAKKLCIIKYPTLRREWLNPARNPRMEYLQLLIDRYSDEYFFVSTADIANQSEEWLAGRLAGIDSEFNRGELDIFTIFGLIVISDMVIGYPSFFLPYCIATKSKFFCIYGGHAKPGLLTDPRMDLSCYGYAAPEPFCNCIQNGHQCNKDIPEEQILGEFERLRQSDV